MKRYIGALAVCLCASLLCSCGGNAPSESSIAEAVTSSEYDIDLTQMSSTMIYSTVSNMMLYPDTYMGENIKMQGQFAVYHDKSADKYYFSVIIPDATACCTQGIEFVLDGDYSYPEDYPAEGDTITVSGQFNTYDEYGFKYCQLIHAKML